MPRKNRDDFPGAWHHVMNRGRNRDLIFRNDDDAILLLDTLKFVTEEFGIEIHAYSLMSNHYHLLVHSPLGTLSRAMQAFGREYTQQYNLRHGGDGALFRGRFKSELITDTRYFSYLVGYIHLNPLRASLITRLDSDMGWTSHRSYMGMDKCPDWLTTDAILEQFVSPQELENFILNLHRGAESWPAEMELATGSFTKGNKKRQKPGRVLAVQIEELVVAEAIEKICEIADVSHSRLRQSIRGPKGNPERRFAIWALNRGTYLTQSEIGQELGITSAHVAMDLARGCSKIPEFSKWEEKWEVYLTT